MYTDYSILIHVVLNLTDTKCPIRLWFNAST